MSSERGPDVWKSRIIELGLKSTLNDILGELKPTTFVNRLACTRPSFPLCRDLALEVYKMSCRIRDIMEGSFLLVTIIGGEGGGRSGVGLLLSGDRRLPLTRSEPASQPDRPPRRHRRRRRRRSHVQI